MMETFIPFAAQAIGWSLLHSLWQGALIYCLMVILFRAFPAMHARLKHFCSVMALLLLLVWTVNTALTQWQQLHTVAVRITPATETAPAYVVEVNPSAPGYNVLLASSYPALAQVMPWLALIYCLGLMAMSLRLGIGVFQLRRLRQNVVLPGDRLTSLLHELQLRLGIMQQVTVRLSARIVMPMVVGIVRPVILLPVTVVDDLGPEGLEAILIHELAHISRADFIINFLQSIVETVLFFNPFAWRISATIRREREHCCDDLVLMYTNKPLIYARALVSLAGRSADVSPLALAATGDRPLLFNRIKRIIEMKQHPFKYTQFIAACSLVAILITVSIACFTPSFAQQSKRVRSTDRPEVNTATRVIVIENGTSHVYNSPDELPEEHRQTLEKSMGTIKKSHRSQDVEDETEEAVGSTPVPATPIAPPAPPVHGIPPAPAVPALPGVPAVPEIPDVDSLVGNATKAAREALAQVDWKEVRRQLAYANKAMEKVDWTAINRDINRSLDPERMRRMQRQLYRAQVVTDPKMAEEIRRQVEAARKQVEEARRRAEAAREELRKAKAFRDAEDSDSTATEEASTNKLRLWNEYRPYAWRVPGAPGC